MMFRLFSIIPFTICSFTVFAQSGLKVHDIQARGHFQIENYNSRSLDELLKVQKKEVYSPTFVEDSKTLNQLYGAGTESNSAIAFSINLSKGEYPEDFNLFSTWQIGFMLVRENDYDSFTEVNEVDTAINQNVNFRYTRNMLRFEIQKLWRTDDRKKAFVSFGVGTQFGYAYNAQLQIFEYNRYGYYNSYNSGYRNTVEAKNALTIYTYLPVDINVKIIENLFVNLELRTGLKFINSFGAFSDVYATYGIGIGTRYLL